MLLYAMFQSFWYLGNTGCLATNDTMYNMSDHRPPPVTSKCVESATNNSIFPTSFVKS